jgi:hypothetical protein
MKPGDMVYVERWMEFEFLMNEVRLDSGGKVVGKFHSGECGVILNVEKRRSGRNVYTYFRVITSNNEVGWVHSFNVKRVR